MNTPILFANSIFNVVKKFSLTVIFFFSLIYIAFTQGIWTQKANFGGGERHEAVGFSIGTKGYIGTGESGLSPGNLNYFNDFWQWDQATDVWTQEANFVGAKRTAAVGFSIGTKGYIGTGEGTSYFKDFWEWDQSTNVWTQKASYGGIAGSYAVGFSIGTKGYIGTGNGSAQAFWEWDQATDTWTQKINIPVGRDIAVGFSIGNKGYIGTGSSLNNFNDFWEWDQATNAWTQKANFGGTARAGAIGFSIGTKGYIGTGSNTQDFWEWDQATNAWTQKANFGGTARMYATGFSIGTKGYLGTGGNGDENSPIYYKDFWEFDPSAQGVEELQSKSHINIYPNPFAEFVTLKIETEAELPFSFSIYDCEGNEVRQNTGIKNKEFTIMRDNLSPGIFFYSVRDKNNLIIGTDKLIIN